MSRKEYDKSYKGYIRLVKAIKNCKWNVEDTVFNQVKLNSKNKHYLAAIRKRVAWLRELTKDNSISVFIYPDDRCIELDIYSEDGYVGSIRRGNLKEIKTGLSDYIFKLNPGNLLTNRTCPFD